MKKFLIVTLCLASITALSQIPKSRPGTSVVTKPAMPASQPQGDSIQQKKKKITSVLEKRIEFIKEEMACHNAAKVNEDFKKCWDTAKAQHESLKSKPAAQPTSR